MRVIINLITASFLLFTVLSWAQPVAPPSDVQTQIAPINLHANVPTSPVAFRGDAQWRLCYEIYLKNESTSPWIIQQIKVMNESGTHTPTPLLTLKGKELETALSHRAPFFKSKGGPVAEVAPGDTVIAYMWIDLAKGAPIPTQLQNQVSLKKSGDEKIHELDAPTSVVSNKLLEIAPPLRGKDWVALSAPSNFSRHRRAVQVFEGVPKQAQRYAIDWVRLGKNGKTYRGERNKIRNYNSYGAQVLAVANGVVVETRDGIPENTPPADSKSDTQPAVKLAVPITLQTALGNHIILDLGEGVYAMYAHLQPGSIRVKSGDKVTTGQVIGLLGNSGNSGEPHLHFQLMDRDSGLNSEGLPYKFSEFKLIAHISGSEGLTESPANLKVNRLPVPGQHRGDIPLENEVVDFGPKVRPTNGN